MSERERESRFFFRTSSAPALFFPGASFLLPLFSFPQTHRPRHAASAPESSLGRHEHVRHVLVLGQQRQVQQDLDGLGVGGHDDKLGDAAVERLGRCCCFFFGVFFQLRGGDRSKESVSRSIALAILIGSGRAKARARVRGGGGRFNSQAAAARRHWLAAAVFSSLTSLLPIRTFVRALPKLLVVGRLLHDVQDRVGQLFVVVLTRGRRRRERENERGRLAIVLAAAACQKKNGKASPSFLFCLTCASASGYALGFTASVIVCLL